MMEEVVWFAALFAVEAIIAWLYCAYLFTQKRSNTYLWISFSIAYMLLFIISRLDDTTLNSVSFLVANYLIVRLNYQCSRKTSLLHSAFLTFIMLMAEVLIALIIGSYGYEFSAYTYDFSVMVALIVFSKFLYFVISIIGARIFSPHKKATEEPQLMIVFFGLPLISVAFAITIIHIGIASGVNKSSALIMLLAVAVLFVVNLLFMVLYNQQQKSAEKYVSLQLSLQRDKADKLYYETLQKQYDGQRILIHDIRNHMQVIDSLARNKTPEKISEYIASLDATLRPDKQISLCDNPILNTLLVHFQKQCLQEGVTFDCDIRSESLQFMDDVGITALFGNILSNALEAASKSQDKQIELSVLRIYEQNIVIISVINSCDLAPCPDGYGGYTTKKKDSSSHGIGLKSIERVVQKYNGTQTMYYSSEEKAFHHIIQYDIDRTAV